MQYRKLHLKNKTCFFIAKLSFVVPEVIVYVTFLLLVSVTHRHVVTFCSICVIFIGLMSSCHESVAFRCFFIIFHNFLLCLIFSQFCCIVECLLFCSLLGLFVLVCLYCFWILPLCRHVWPLVQSIKFQLHIMVLAKQSYIDWQKIIAQKLVFNHLKYWKLKEKNNTQPSHLEFLLLTESFSAHIHSQIPKIWNSIAVNQLRSNTVWKAVVHLEVSVPVCRSFGSSVLILPSART